MAKTLYISKALTIVAVAYEPEVLIATQKLPAIPVAQEAGQYFKYGKEAFRIDDAERANGAPAKEVTSYSTTTGTYTTKTYAYKDIVTDRDRANADAPVNPEMDTTKGLTGKIKTLREKKVADALFNVTTFASYTAALAAADKWSNYTESDPLDKIDEAKENVRKQIGIKANTMIIGIEVFNKLKRHPQLLDIYKHTQRGILTPELIAEAAQLKRVIVGEAIYDSAAEGATFTGTNIWGNYALICFINDPKTVKSLKVPNLGFIPYWKIYGKEIAKVKKYRVEDREGDWVEVEQAFDTIIAIADAGYLYSTVV